MILQHPLTGLTSEKANSVVVVQSHIGLRRAGQAHTPRSALVLIVYAVMAFVHLIIGKILLLGPAFPHLIRVKQPGQPDSLLHSEVADGYGIGGDALHLRHIDSCIHRNLRAAGVGEVFCLTGFRRIDLLLDCFRSGTQRQQNAAHKYQRKESFHIFHLHIHGIMRCL